MNTQVFLAEVKRDVGALTESMSEGVAYARIPVVAGDRWAIKLNLTYPKYLPGVVNSPVFVEALCRFANDHALRLQLVEGDGGNGSYSAEDTFRGNGITEIAGRYGAECVSLSRKPWLWRTTRVLDKTVSLPYSPFFARREYDRFGIAPLFKNHVYTVATLGMKNLWGCIPDPYRMYYHHQLDHGIVALYEELSPEFSLFDGLVALRGRGPMDGDPFDWNLMMAAGSVGAGERAALKLMGVSTRAVRHLDLARRLGHMPASAKLVWSQDPAPFERNDFIPNRSIFNHASIALSRFPRLMRLVYHSPLSKAIYGVVNALRPGSPQADLVRAKQEGAYESRPMPGPVRRGTARR